MQAAGALGYLPQQQPQAQMMAGGSNNAGSGQAASEESARDSAGAGGGQSTGASAEGVPVATTGGSHAQAQQLKQAPHLVPGAGKAAPKDSAEDEATSSMSLPVRLACSLLCVWGMLCLPCSRMTECPSAVSDSVFCVTGKEAQGLSGAGNLINTHMTHK